MVATLAAPSRQLDAQRAAARADIYTILSACFAPPTPALLEQAVQGRLADSISLALSALPLVWQPIGPALRQFEVMPARIGGPTLEEATRRAALAYTRLFLGPGTSVVSLHEAAYTEPAPGSSSAPDPVAVARCVEDAYVDACVVTRDRAEPPDHLTAELAFIACLYDREARALASGYERVADEAAQSCHRFLDEHLRRWAPAVARLTLAYAHHPLYIGAASLLWSAVEADR